MTDKELIKQEIERLSDEYPMSRALLKHLDKFIDSLPEEPVSEDLEEAAELYYEEDCPYEGDARVVNNEHDIWFPSQAIEDAFIAGAKWHRKRYQESSCEANCTPENENLKEEISKWRNHYISVLENNLRIDLRDIEVTANHFAEWQKQQMIEKAVEWLEEHTTEYASFDDDKKADWENKMNFIENFKKYMKD